MKLRGGGLWLLVGLCACDSAAERGRQAQDMAEAAGARTAEAARSARAWAEGLRLGELSDRARAWLRAGAEASQSGIESVLQRGEQVVPVALEIGRVLGEAIDSDTALEPIYQEVEGSEALALQEVDAAIQGMPRVEVIDGVSVGFKQLSSVDAGHHVAESAYLVMWRQGDRLVGFVFRSRRDIAIDQLVREAPRLVALVRSVL